MKNILYTIILSFLFSSGVFALEAEDFQAILDAYVAEDHETALRELRILAEKGNAKAMFFLARWYGMSLYEKKFRTLVEQGDADALYFLAETYEHEGDDTEAFKLNLRAAKQGHAKAQYKTGYSYEIGCTIGCSDENRNNREAYNREALKWYLLAAEQGFDHAMVKVGDMYRIPPPGITENVEEGIKLYLLAAESGNSMGQWKLGWLYENGSEVIKNYTLAHMWFNISASGPQVKLSLKEQPKVKLGTSGRIRVEKKMTPEQIAEAQRLARECVKKNYKDCG